MNRTSLHPGTIHRARAYAGLFERPAMRTRGRVWWLALAFSACLWAGMVYAQEPMEAPGPPPVQDAAQADPAAPAAPMPPEAPVPEVTAPVEQEPEPAPEVQEPPAAPAPAPVPRPLPVRPRPGRPARPSEMRNATPGQRGALTPPGQSKAAPSMGEPANPDTLPKEGKTPTDPISFDFTNQDLSEVVAAIARMTGKNFDVDPAIASAKITIITHSKIPPEMAYQVLHSILQSRNLSMVETLGGNLVKIVQANTLMEKVPIVKGADGLPKDKYDQLETHIVKLQHADSAEVVPILQNLGSQTVRIDAYQKSNTLIITDTTDGLRRIFTFIDEVDIPGFDSEMEIFTLEYSRAEVLAQQIQEVLMGNTSAPRQGQPTAARPQQAVRPSARPTVPGQNVSTVAGSRDETLRIVPDDRLNSLIVVASAELMKRVRDLVGKLDTPTPYEANNMNIYRLLNADSEKVEKALNAILGTAPRQANEKAPSQSGEIQPFEKKVVVTRYEENNSLIILAAPQDYKLIREIIAQLDIPQRQVLIESVIMNITINDKFELNVNAASVTGSSGFVTTSTDMMKTQATALTTEVTSLLAATTATQMANILAAGQLNTASSALTLSSDAQFTAGLYRDVSAVVNIPGVGRRRIHIPFTPLLIKSLQTLTDTDILSQPSLTTQDNQEANIVVGQELPIVTSRPTYTNPTSSTATTSTAYNAYSGYGYGYGSSSVTRQDVGVKMKVKPHINEGDYVSMETEIEVSSQATNTSIDANNLGPTLNKSKVTNNVVVKDGCTGVIGGLITESTSHSKSQAPLLSDLPLIGWAFGSKSNERKKQNMVVLVTPHIIKEGADLDRVSQYKLKEFRDENVDILFDKGIIKKVRRGTHMRNTHRPSAERTEKMMEAQDTFGRGDIER